MTNHSAGYLSWSSLKSSSRNGDRSIVMRSVRLGSGRVVVVRSLRSWLPTRERPLEPLSWPRKLLARLRPRRPSPLCSRAFAAGLQLALFCFF